MNTWRDQGQEWMDPSVGRDKVAGWYIVIPGWGPGYADFGLRLH